MSTYKTSKYLARVLTPLMGKIQYHVKDSDDLVRKLKHVKIEEDECMVSFDFKSLFTKVPKDEAVIIIHDKLSADDTLSQRTPLSADKLTELTAFYLKSTYLKYGGDFYKQKCGTTLGVTSFYSSG